LGVTLFVAPHLDDVALSCPVHVLRAGEALIATVFTEPQHAHRRQEDREAAAVLGADVEHLAFHDAPFRDRAYGDFAGIVFGQAPEYDGTRDRVARALRSLLPADVVVAPLAVGNHVDHRLVRDAALQAVPAERLRFYEDRPYSFLREQLDQVLGRLIPPPSDDHWKAYFGAPYVRAYLGGVDPGHVRLSWHRVARFPQPLEEASTLTPTAAESDTAVRAVRCYRSQVPDLFADSAEIESRYRDTPERLHRLA
jgi:LmbE family N-acetylglucosaminyl deacetylase